MDEQSKDAVFFELASRYNWLSSKKEKMDFLFEIESLVLPKLGIKSMHRKSLIRRLRSDIFFEEKLPGIPRGRKSTYNDIEKGHLIQLWKLSGYPCGKRLKTILKDWLCNYKCSDQIKSSLLKMSAAQMDRLLEQARIDHQRKVQSGTVPAKNHIKKLIKLRDPFIRYTEPGYIESDTVLHCGHYIWGWYAHTVSLTDLFCGWTDGRSTYTKNAELVVRALVQMQSTLPMKMQALFFDNGCEFINHLLVQTINKSAGVDVARGRAGKSNDQCHIEQKNNTFVRSIFGNVRIENPELIPMMNEIYDVWGKLHNYFMPQMKLISKERINGKIKKKYDEPKTPYQRLMESDAYPQELKERLTAIKSTLNPFELQAELQKKLALFHKLNDEYNEKVNTRIS